jgi:hypothetical protein
MCDATEAVTDSNKKNRDLPLVDRWIWRQLRSSSAPRIEYFGVELSRFEDRLDSLRAEMSCEERVYRPQLLFLSETKMMDNKAENFMWSFGFDCSIPVTALHLVVDFVLEVHS